MTETTAQEASGSTIGPSDDLRVDRFRLAADQATTQLRPSRPRDLDVCARLGCAVLALGGGLRA